MYAKTGYIFSPVVTVLSNGKVLKSRSISVDHITDFSNHIKPQNSMSNALQEACYVGQVQFVDKN